MMAKITSLKIKLLRKYKAYTLKLQNVVKKKLRSSKCMRKPGVEPSVGHSPSKYEVLGSITKTTKKWVGNSISYSWVQILSIVKVVIPLKWIQRYNEIPVRTSVDFSVETEVIFKFIQNSKELTLGRSILTKENKINLTSQFQVYYNATVINQHSISSTRIKIWVTRIELIVQKYIHTSMLIQLGHKLIFFFFFSVFTVFSASFV